MIRPAACWVALALCAVACLGPRGPRLPPDALEGWHSIEVGDVRLVAEASPRDAAALAAELAGFDAAFAYLVGGRIASHNPTAIHLIRPPERALAEARRVLRDGPLVVVAFTLENVGPLFIREYFPTADIPFDENPPRERLLSLMRSAGFGRVEWEKFVYTDSVDGTLLSLHTDPVRLAGPAYLRNTSFFQRVPEAARAEGLARLGRDLRSGVLEERVKEAYRQSLAEGHGAVFACWP